MYPIEVLRHFESPQNAGELAGADAVARVENPACGDILELSLSMNDGFIAAVMFRAKGCVAAVAAGSALTTLLQGKPLSLAARLTREDLVRELGGLTPESMHVSHLAMDAWAQAQISLKAMTGAKACT